MVGLRNLAGSIDDCNERVRFQTRSTHQSSVDIRLAQEFQCVVCLHAAAVLNANLIGRIRAEEFFEQFANRKMDFFA